jgi:hypothetical protein
MKKKEKQETKVTTKMKEKMIRRKIYSTNKREEKIIITIVVK